MTPKEKAEELIEKYYSLYEGIELSLARKHWARRSALIAVNEILEATKTKYKWGGGSPEKLVHFEEVKYDTYWQEVKQEIEKL